MMKWLWAIIGTILTLLGFIAIANQAFAGLQPWDGELSDALIFAKSIPFTIGFGVLVGSLRSASGQNLSTKTNGTAKVRRFSPGTVIGHWITSVGFFLALATGSWQYLGGVLEVNASIPLYLFYRVHYIGGTLLLFSFAYFLTYWALSGEKGLLVPSGRWIRHFRGLAHELPKSVGAFTADLLGLDMKRPAPPVGQFTYYEKTLSFPIWLVLLTLITVTGLIKALRYIYPVPGGVLYWASTLHVATMVLLGIKLLDHMRYTFARWPLMVSMVTTWVSERYVQLRHPAWYSELTERSVKASGAPLAGSNEPSVAPQSFGGGAA